MLNEEWMYLNQEADEFRIAAINKAAEAARIRRFVFNSIKIQCEINGWQVEHLWCGRNANNESSVVYLKVSKVYTEPNSAGTLKKSYNIEYPEIIYGKKDLHDFLHAVNFNMAVFYIMFQHPELNIKTADYANNGSIVIGKDNELKTISNIFSADVYNKSTGKFNLEAFKALCPAYLEHPAQSKDRMLTQFKIQNPRFSAYWVRGIFSNVNGLVKSIEEEALVGPRMSSAALKI